MYANVFNIFKFELNPLDDKKDIGLYVLFRTFQVNFQDISYSVTLALVSFFVFYYFLKKMMVDISQISNMSF